MDRDISRSNLVRHEIYFEPNVYQANHENTQTSVDALPDHVDAVRDGLLLMEGILPEDCETFVHKDSAKNGSVSIGPEWCLRPHGSAFVYGKHHERVLQQSAFHDNFKLCEQISEDTRGILDDSEEEWNLFWRTAIFTRFSDEARKQSGFSPTLDTWSLYGNVQWNEFDNFTKTCPPAANRTQPKPDLTYAFPFQTSAPETLRGFARDELTQTLSLQSLGKLVEQGVACAPTTALANYTISPGRATWSTSDRSCFPWAIVEMKKRALSPNDNAVERCYCQAANAAAAALDLQAQLFDKVDDSCSLQLPPVVAFTCIGPVVKVWLAYQDESNHSSIPVQRMVCIWSTSVRLIWGVASSRAIIKNMHTWSSRLLKPKLQAAIIQATGNLHMYGRVEPPIPMMPSTANISSIQPSPSSRATPDHVRPFGEPITPVRYNTPAAPPRNDTPTQSSSPGDIQARRTSNSQNNTVVDPGNGLFGGRSTTGTPGLFGRGTGSGTGLFGRSSQGFGSNTGTAIGSGFGLQNANKTDSPFGCLGKDAAGQDTSGSEANNGFARGAPFESPKPAISPFGMNSKNNGSPPSGSAAKPALGSSSALAFESSSTSDGFGSGSFGGFGTTSSSSSSSSNKHELPNFSKPSNNITLSNPGGDTSLPAAKDTDVSNLTAAFGSTRLEDAVNNTGPTFDTACTPFTAYTERVDNSWALKYQSITVQSPYVNYSLEELRLADYSQGRQYGMLSHESNQSTDSSKTKGTHTGNELLEAPKPGPGELSGTSVLAANRKTNDDSRSPYHSGLNTPTRPSHHLTNSAFVESDDDSDYDHSSDSSSEGSTFGGRIRTPISGDRLIDLQMLRTMTSDLRAWQQHWIIQKVSYHYRNPNGTYSVPLQAVVGHINGFLKPADRIY